MKPDTEAHPFPPVVRWALFPALAALAGAAGGALGTRLTGREVVLELAAMAGGLAAGAAFAGGLAARAWPCLLAAPVLGAFGVSGAVALVASLKSGGNTDPWQLVRWILEHHDALLLLGGGALLLVGVHRLSREAGWPRTLLAAAIAALLLFLGAQALVDGSDRVQVSAFLALATLAQAPAVRGAAAVARRLNK